MVSPRVVSGSNYASKEIEELLLGQVKQGRDEVKKFSLAKDSFNVEVETFHDVVVVRVVLDNFPQVFEELGLTLREVLVSKCRRLGNLLDATVL